MDRCTVQYLVDVTMRTYLEGTHFATDGALIRGLGRGGSYFVLNLFSLYGDSSDVNMIQEEHTVYCKHE